MICRSNLGADWFLPTLFVASIILFLISKTDKRIVQLLIGIVFISAAAFCNAEMHIQLVAGRCFIASFFMIIGYSFKRLFYRRISPVLCIFFFCLTVLIAVINGQVGMYELEMHNIVLFIVGAVLGTTVIINVSKSLSISGCTRVGRNSLVIMGTHQHIIYIVRRLGLSIVGFLPTALLWLGMVVYSNLIAGLFYSVKDLLAAGKFGERYYDEYGK